MTPRRGAGLLETLFAFGVVCGVILVIFTVFPTSVVAIRKGNDRLQAGALVHGLLAEERLKPFSELKSYTPPPTTIDGVKFTPKVVVSPVGGTNDPNRLLKVVASVTWDLQGRTQALEAELWTCSISRH